MEETVNLIPISYRNRKYPEDIFPKIIEIPAHFDINFDSKRNPLNSEYPLDTEYSLHTEYSYDAREFKCSACKGLSGIKVTDGGGVPKLWFDDAWVTDFIQFILQFKERLKTLKIIEIHPPFSDYCENLDQFIKLYKNFEDKIKSECPKSEIFIENRTGRKYSGGSFILSNVDDLTYLVKLIKKNDLKLRIALDIQQLFSAELQKNSEDRLSEEGLSDIFKRLYPIRDYIGSIHLWGRCVGKNGSFCPHIGTLDSYFQRLTCEEIKAKNEKSHDSYMKLEASNDNNNIKKQFLRELHHLLRDGSPRYFLPEVNSTSEHLQSIVNDLKKSKFDFI